MILDIKQEAYFPFTFKLMGVLLFLFAVLQWVAELPFVVKILITLIAPLLGLAMITTRYGLRIDVDKGEYTVYTWLLGMKTGRAMPFKYIEKIYINEVTESATVTARSGLASDVHKKVYKAFMKLDTGEKVHLDTDRRLERLEARVSDYETALNSLIVPNGK